MISKYIFDRSISFIILLIFSPLLLFIATLIKIKMPEGPVIFRQKRVGRNGNLFTLYKFRTMTVEHSGNSVSVLGDPRITRLGESLRKHKLDELVELFNVLKGDMSFVGPRPDVQGYVDLLQGEDRKILELRPGLTGPASLKYIHEEQLLTLVENPNEYNDKVIFPDKVKINLEYYYNRTFYGDLKIICKTVFSIIRL
jgi:lipopolysaccharide/colanic/teichoic acid biosynthesis glycosyltransferase